MCISQLQAPLTQSYGVLGSLPNSRSIQPGVNPLSCSPSCNLPDRSLFWLLHTGRISKVVWGAHGRPLDRRRSLERLQPSLSSHLPPINPLSFLPGAEGEPSLARSSRAQCLHPNGGGKLGRVWDPCKERTLDVGGPGYFMPLMLELWNDHFQCLLH